MSTKYQMDMRTGSLAKKMLLFSLPLILTNTLQLLYNAADVIVVGQFAGKEALSAVGATGALINLLLNLFIGISVGSSVVVSRYFGSYDYDGMQETIHTSITIAGISGVFVGILGFVIARPTLQLMNTPPDVIDGAVQYMQIYFIGMPVNLLYNFGSAILRAVGDTKRPLYFLTISGVLNVVLNLFFVIVLQIGVAGVALATIIAQALSAFLVIRSLIRSDGALKLDPKKLKMHKDKLIMIVKIGLPAGLQGSMFSISNTIIQSTINTFGSATIAASAASSNIEGFVYMAMNSVHQATITFSSQNFGAQQYKRVRRVLWHGISLISLICIIWSSILYIFAHPLISLYNSDPEVIAIGVYRLQYFCRLYLLMGWMDVVVGQMRAIGYSTLSMMIAVGCICLFRVFWVYAVFPLEPTFDNLLLSYPVSWILNVGIQFACYFFVLRKIPRNNEPLPQST